MLVSNINVGARLGLLGSGYHYSPIYSLKIKLLTVYLLVIIQLTPESLMQLPHSH